MADLGQTLDYHLGSKNVPHPNRPRPPNDISTPQVTISTSKLLNNNEDTSAEGEVFEDANDQRGAANKDFYMFCKQYVSINKPAMLVIMELRCDPNKLRRSCELLGYEEFIATTVEGYAGGILVAWKKEYITVDVCCKNFQYIHLKVKYSNGEWWYFTPIYASPSETRRNALWNDLKIIASSINESWLIAGDFNDIVSAEEKRGGASASRRKCNIFKDRIDACNLIDMGPKFTWRGPIFHGGQRIFERLDRALCNDQWRLKFPEGFVKVLNRLDYSDHHPILISPLHVPHLVAERQFRFESAWLLEDKYNSMLQQSWIKDDVIINNLQNVMRDIRVWKLQTLDQVMKEKRELIGRLNGIQRHIQDGRNSGGLVRLERKLQSDLNTILRKEELMWYQRSRAKWLTDGDRNTKYYHLKTVNRRRRNNIVMLKDGNGHWVEDVDQLQNLAKGFYMKLFSNDHISRDWHQTDISYPVIDPDMKDKLGAPILEDEIKRAVFHMHPWKAPGPDGFPAGFYQKSWNIVGTSVCNFVQNVWHNPSNIAEVNQTDICLIPKVSHPEYIQQFRPISLCNTIYKIVSKVIVERLKECIADLVSPFQTGFVPGRNIHENIIVAKEMAHSMHHMKGRKGAFAIKVDLAKAYDKISWEFIWRILTEIKFPDALVNIIMHGVTSVMTNVKWNGTRSKFFKPQRGIRQGDPLSPYLFVLCMDKLSHLILHAVNSGKWIGIKAGRNGPMVSHLMFADDLLLFGTASEAQMRCVIDTLYQFCNMSGQEVSYDKTSILFSRNVPTGLRNHLINMSGFKETNDFGKYLGVPLNGRAPKRADFQYILDQVSTKLAAWKAKHLSFAGRVTLAKSVIEAVPIYPMMSTKIPKTCLDEIHKMQRQFIWGDTEHKRRFHAVGWDSISVPKWMGGLGLRKLEVMNQACLMKLGWKIQVNSEDYWCSVLHGKYNSGNSTANGTTRASHSSLWKTLHKLIPKMNMFSYWSVGDGRKINAWNDAWLDEGVRIDEQVIIPPHMRGLEVIELVDSEGEWNWSLLNNWLPANMLNKIAAILPPSDAHGSDEKIMVGGKTNEFSVASMYNKLCEFQRDEAPSMWSKIWKLQVPERVRAFIWVAKHNRLLTNFLKKKMGLNHAMCMFCGDVEESTLHVLRDCPLAMGIWCQVVPPRDKGMFFMSDLENWISFNLSNSVMWNSNIEWCVFWAVACHSLWSWRNKEEHEEEFARPYKPEQYIMQRAIEYDIATRNSKIVTGRNKVVTLIRWSPPKASFVKLNTDGAYRKNNIAGCGGAIRGSQGEWLGGFARCVGLCSAFVAELWGVLEGLRCVRRLGFSKVELNIDSAAVVQVLRERRVHSSQGHALARQIWKLLDMDWTIEISHTYREANKCADALANLGCSLDYKLVFYEDFPLSISEIITNDSLGIATPRLIIAL